MNKSLLDPNGGDLTSPSRTLAGNLGHPKKQCRLLGDNVAYGFVNFRNVQNNLLSIGSC